MFNFISKLDTKFLWNAVCKQEKKIERKASGWTFSYWIKVGIAYQNGGGWLDWWLMDGWMHTMDGWMIHTINEWMGGWMDTYDGWIYGWYMDGWVDGYILWMDGWMYEWMDTMYGWVDGYILWMDGWIDTYDGWMNGWWIIGWMDIYTIDGCIRWMDG